MVTAVIRTYLFLIKNYLSLQNKTKQNEKSTVIHCAVVESLDSGVAQSGQEFVLLPLTFSGLALLFRFPLRQHSMGSGDKLPGSATYLLVL